MSEVSLRHDWQSTNSDTNLQSLSKDHDNIKNVLLNKSENVNTEDSQNSALSESTMHKVGRWALKILGGLLIAAGAAVGIATIFSGAAIAGAGIFAATCAAGIGLICTSNAMAPNTNPLAAVGNENHTGENQLVVENQEVNQPVVENQGDNQVDNQSESRVENESVLERTSSNIKHEETIIKEENKVEVKSDANTEKLQQPKETIIKEEEEERNDQKESDPNTDKHKNHEETNKREAPKISTSPLSEEENKKSQNNLVTTDKLDGQNFTEKVDTTTESDKEVKEYMENLYASRRKTNESIDELAKELKKFSEQETSDAFTKEIMPSRESIVAKRIEELKTNADSIRTSEIVAILKEFVGECGPSEDSREERINELYNMVYDKKGKNIQMEIKYYINQAKREHWSIEKLKNSFKEEHHAWLKLKNALETVLALKELNEYSVDIALKKDAWKQKLYMKQLQKIQDELKSPNDKAEGLFAIRGTDSSIDRVRKTSDE